MIRMLLHDFGMGADEPMALNGDHRPTKQIDVRYHFVNDKIMEKQIVIKHVTTEFQIADMLTKALALPTLVNMRIMMLGK